MDTNQQTSPMASAPALAVLEEHYANARLLKCCPSMDLIAVLTEDGSLAVHRATSWQKLVSVAASDALFDIVALEWSPNGLFLAVGGEDGNLVVYDIETGQQTASCGTSRHTSRPCHQHTITSLYWTSILAVNNSISSDLDNPLSDRSSRLLQHVTSGGERHTKAIKSKEQMNILTSVDEQGYIGIWWDGELCLTMLHIEDLLDSPTQEVNEEVSRVADGAYVSQDLSMLHVIFHISQANVETDYHLISVELRAMQTAMQDVASIAHVAKEVDEALEAADAACKKVVTEWKNATRIFELKMGLLGSVYEKYGRDTAPQMDMLSASMTGVMTPPLEQYFAQDIQEMSIVRMQKAMSSGCSTLMELIRDKIKSGLEVMLFHLGELRGRVRWNEKKENNVFALDDSSIEMLLHGCREMLVEMESLVKALHTTALDFEILLRWLSNCIRAQSSSDTAPSFHSTENVSNIHRLQAFLQRAAKVAYAFSEDQTQRFKVEPTFGNTVSEMIRKLTKGSSRVGSMRHMEQLHQGWSQFMQQVTRTIGRMVTSGDKSTLDLGTNIRTHKFYVGPVPSEDDMVDSGSDSDDGPDLIDPIETLWSSLRHVVDTESKHRDRETLMGVIQKDGSLLILRQKTGHVIQEDMTAWEAVLYSTGVLLETFAFYAITASHTVRIAAITCEKSDTDSDHKDVIYVYDCALKLTSDSTSSTQVQSFSCCTYYTPPYSHFTSCMLRHLEQSDIVTCREQEVEHFPTDFNLSSTYPVLDASGDRGLVVVGSRRGRVSVYDAANEEDDEDVDEDEDEVDEQS